MQFQYYLIGVILVFSTCAAMGDDPTPQNNQDIQMAIKEISEIKNQLKLTEQTAKATETRIRAIEESLVDAMNSIASALSIPNHFSIEDIDYPEVFKNKVVALGVQLRTKFQILEQKIAIHDSLIR